jgi:hypothetical protein
MTRHRTIHKDPRAKESCLVLQTYKPLAAVDIDRFWEFPSFEQRYSFEHMYTHTHTHNLLTPGGGLRRKGNYY